MDYQNPYDLPGQPPFHFEPPQEKAPAPPLSREGQRGKSLIRTIVVLNVALGLFVLLMVIARQQWDAASRIFFQFVLTLGTACALWNGDRLTRYLYVLAGALITFFLLRSAVRASPLLAIGAVFSGYITLRLAFSPGVSEFLETQRARQADED